MNAAPKTLRTLSDLGEAGLTTDEQRAALERVAGHPRARALQEELEAGKAVEHSAARSLAQAQREATQAQAGADARPELKPMLEALARGDIGGAKRALVLLAHQPKTFTDASKLGVDLQLSGHTHGGQIFPLGLFAWLQQGFLAGLFQQGESTLYVSRGTGYWGPPLRLLAPPEITHIEIRSA